MAGFQFFVSVYYLFLYTSVFCRLYIINKLFGILQRKGGGREIGIYISVVYQ